MLSIALKQVLNSRDLLFVRVLRMLSIALKHLVVPMCIGFLARIAHAIDSVETFIDFAKFNLL